jgi:archaellum component FlaG (FlaF/FlaG flagellin family)
MGFSLTGTSVIYFITTIIIAGLVSGIIVSISTDTDTSMTQRSARIQDQLHTDFMIINDPYLIPFSDNGEYRLFYLKNTGDKKFLTTNDTFQIFMNGNLIPKENYNFAVSTVESGKVATLYIKSSEVTYGDHILKVIGPQALSHEFIFTI